jgi:uncharacterized protein
MKTVTRYLAMGLLLLAAAAAPAGAAERLKVLLVDGQNNHDWKSCQPVLKWILEDCGRFTVDVSTAPPAPPRKPQPPKEPATDKQKAAHQAALKTWQAEKDELAKAGADRWQQWRPRFRDYDVIVSNYNGDEWPAEVKADFAAFVRGGGGLVAVHAADNSFGSWPEYNEMIGVGGWGGRNEKSGPMLYWQDGAIARDTSPGAGGTHGAQHEFVVETRVADHPVMRGLPARWKHAADELYSKLRGPASNLTVLATAYADPAQRGTGKNEPILMAIGYGQGRVFHTVLGHGPAAMAGLGFQVTLQRGTEWAATGKVTLPPPAPGALSAETAALKPPPTSK